MKHLKKIYENFDDEETFNVGDTVYCTENRGYEQDIEIGVPYTVAKVDDRIKDYTVITLAELESRWSSRRFSKNPEHAGILKHKLSPIANKYNL